MRAFLTVESRVCRPARSTWASKRNALVPWLLAVTLAMTAQQGWAATCSLSVQAVSFGSYDTFSNVALDSTGNISVTCDISAPYTIALSAGGGSYARRAMAKGTHRLNYNLYTDATHTAVWGTGAGGTAMVNGSGTSRNHAVYGRIPATQNADVGSYSDIITVILNF